MGRTRGRRHDFEQPAELVIGEYGRQKVPGGGLSGPWYVSPPGGGVHRLNERWTVEEHPDGTITVHPSINVTSDEHAWHGWLTRGEWKGV